MTDLADALDANAQIVPLLCDGLRALGVPVPASTEPAPAPVEMRPASPRRVWLVATLAFVVAAGIAAWFTLRPSVIVHRRPLTLPRQAATFEENPT